MKKIFYNSQSQPVELSRKLGTGGEGSVYEIANQPDDVAKIYHEAPSPEKAEKLIALSKLSNERLLKIAAWPVDVLRSEADGQFAGFVMKKIGQAAEVHTLHSPKSRLQKFPDASWAFLIYVAANVARAVATTHEHGFVVGDLNPKNILVTHQATVALLDCDSFQVTAEGKTYRCEGGFPEYLPPELQGQSLRDVERTQEHDCFGLAVIIFQLLFMGRHPFSGRFLGAGEQTLEEAIRHSRFAFGEDAFARQMQQPPGTLSLEAIPSSLSNLFRRAFLSADRPNPHEWIEPLETLAKTLKPCTLHSGHHFFDQLDECPWCPIELRARIRLFNFSLNGQNGKRTHFRLDQVWGEITKLETQTKSLALIKLKKDEFLVTTASPEAAKVVRARQMKLILSVIFAAASGFATGFFVPWPFAFLLAVFVGIAAKKIADAEFSPYINSIGIAQQRFSAPDDPLVNQIRQQLDQANQMVQTLETRLEKISAGTDLLPKLEALKNRKETHEHLPQIREYRLKQLEIQMQDRQLNEFLSSFEIDEKEINGIGQQIKDRLLASGVTTAADVTPERLKAIPGIAEARAQRLLFWRAEKKRGFVFDPTRDNLPQARVTLERELDNLQMQLEHELASGAVFLQRVNQELSVQWQQSASALPEAYRQQSQAEKDWEAVSKRNPLWPIVIILSVAFLYGAFISIYFESERPSPAYEYSTTSSEPEPQVDTVFSEDVIEARKRFEEGEKLVLQGKWEAAASEFRKVIALAPEHPSAHAQLGYALYRLRRYDQAIEALTRATEIADAFEPNFYLGMIYKAQKNWDFAEDSFVRAIELNINPNDSLFADANYYLSQSLAKNGELNDEIARMEEQFKTDIAYTNDLLQLATHYLWAGKPNLAKQQLDTLKTRDENLARQLERLIKLHQRG